MRRRWAKLPLGSTSRYRQLLLRAGVAPRGGRLTVTADMSRRVLAANAPGDSDTRIARAGPSSPWPPATPTARSPAHRVPRGEGRAPWCAAASTSTSPSGSRCVELARGDHAAAIAALDAREPMARGFSSSSARQPRYRLDAIAALRRAEPRAPGSSCACRVRSSTASGTPRTSNMGRARVRPRHTPGGSPAWPRPGCSSGGAPASNGRRSRPTALRGWGTRPPRSTNRWQPTSGSACPAP